MANALFTKAFLPPSAAIKSGENASYPASNVLSYVRPYRLWKADDLATTTYAGLDLGSAVAVKALFVDNLSVTSVSIEADDAATFDSAAGSPQYESGILTVSRDRTDQRFKLFHWDGSGGTLFTRRYVRVRSETSSSATDDIVMTMGSLTAYSLATVATRNFTFPYVKTGRVREDNGTIAGQRYADLTLTWNNIPTNMETELLRLNQEFRGQPFLFYRNFGNTYEAYICRIASEVSVEWAGPNHLKASQMVLREYGGEIL